MEIFNLMERFENWFMLQEIKLQLFIISIFSTITTLFGLAIISLVVWIVNNV